MSRGVLLLLLMVAWLPVRAHDLGVIGPTYAIAEPDLLQDLRRRLESKQASGELDAMMAERRRRGISAVQSPTPVPGVTATRTARSFFYDPTFTLDRNVLDPNGRLLFAAGTQTNPLDVVSLSSPLLFFDGRDPRQRDHARQLITSRGGKVKPVLVAGSYLELMKAWGSPVYYDQQGALTQRLGITQVPAMVSQDGSRLRIDELEIQQ